jgi:class 3 adenylate cyclase/tetratricopeptide (TPR) repeat protein
MYGIQCLALSRKYGQKRTMAYVYGSLGLNHRYKGEYDQALAYYDSSRKISEEIGDKAGVAGAYDNISVVKIDQSDYPKALDYAFKSLEIEEALHNYVAGNYINVSIIYTDMGKCDKAIDYLQKAKKIAETERDSSTVRNAMSNMARNYLITGKYSEALEIELKLIKYGTRVGNKAALLADYSYIATAYYYLNDLSSASKYFLKGLEIAQQVKNKKSVAENLGNLGEIYLGMAVDSIRKLDKSGFPLLDKRTALKKAIAYSQQSADLHMELHNYRDLSANYNTLSTAWELLGEDKKALAAYKQYRDYYDSVFSKANKNKIANLEKQRELDSIKQQVKIDKLKIAQQNLTATKKRNEQVYLIIAMGLLVGVVVFIAVERRKSERLLLNILPHSIAERLKDKEHPIADHFKEASIIFIDMAGFTKLSENRDPKETVTILNDIFTRFDGLAEKYGLEKIKTIGDCYMAVAGLPVPHDDHAIMAAKMALAVKETMRDYKAPDGMPIQFRIGLDCGPVVAGVIGKKKFIYDLWGNAVNTASRMESTGLAGEIHCTDNFKLELEKEHAAHFKFTARGTMEVKGKGAMQTWFINAA